MTGTFDFSDALQPLETLRGAAPRCGLPDRLLAVDSAIRHESQNWRVANGSTDPTYTGWFTNTSSTNNPNGPPTIGVSLSIPLRIFDRNQGEKNAPSSTSYRCRRRAKQLTRKNSATWTWPTSWFAAIFRFSSRTKRRAITGVTRARHRNVFPRARRHVFDGFSQRAKRLPPGAIRHMLGCSEPI